MDKEWEDYLATLKAKGLHLECAFGCEFYHYTCSGNPETNPCCPSAVVCDENGNEVKSMNYIKDVITENGITTFFLQTDDEPQIWYWSVPTLEVGGDYYAFVNDERNSHLGTSVAGFDTLQEAYDDYYEGTEV